MKKRGLRLFVPLLLMKGDNREKIALVDDDVDILEIFAHFINFFGYVPLFLFQNPGETLRKIPDKSPAP
jgi:hypothetical protein